MNLIGRLLLVATAYSEHTGINLRLLGDRIFSDRRRIEALQQGSADLNTRSYEKAMAWFSENWPENLGWPEGVERPCAGESQQGETGAAA